MYLEPYTELAWAYQLHYYICFRTYRRRLFWSTTAQQKMLSESLEEICNHHTYHLLQHKLYPDHLRCLISLRPEHAIAKTLQTLKSNSAREFIAQNNLRPPLWARGYLARSVGKTRIDAVKRYLEQQAEHHGYSQRILPPVFRYRAPSSIKPAAAHAHFELNYHLVFATRYRKGVFTSALGEALSNYWLKVAAKHGFAIDQISVVPDHLHLLVRTVSQMSIETCALALLNNGQHFIGKHFPQTLITNKIDRLWQPSAYAGTCGQATTALTKFYLSRDD